MAQLISNDHAQKKQLDTISFILETEFTLKGIPTNAKFDLNKYIEVFGKPEKIQRGGPEIIKEFGCDDYMIKFSKIEIWAGHCYLSDAFIEEKDIDINGVEIGDKRTKIEKTFNIETKKNNEVWIYGNAVLILFFNENDCVEKMHFSQNNT